MAEMVARTRPLRIRPALAEIRRIQAGLVRVAVACLQAEQHKARTQKIEVLVAQAPAQNKHIFLECYRVMSIPHTPTSALDVIISVYNAGTFLADSVESAAVQVKAMKRRREPLVPGNGFRCMDEQGRPGRE
jgi:hypothetical protein